MHDDPISDGYKDKLSLGNKLHRLFWGLVWLLLFRPSLRKGGNRWRLLLLRCFGARFEVLEGSIRPSCRIWMPSNLKCASEFAIDDNVLLYNVDSIYIGKKAVISREVFLCTATHNITSPDRELVTAPIVVGDFAWVAARAFIGPGVTIGEGAVVGACAVVTKDVEPWTVVAGNPAKFIKKRVIAES